MGQTPPSPSLMSKWDQWLSLAERWLTWAGAAALALLLGVTLLEVLLRNLFDRPILGFVDMVEWFLPLIGLAGVGAAQSLGEHFRMDLAVRAMPVRIRWAVEAITTLAALGFAASVAVYAIRAAFQAWSVGYVSPDIEWPLWPPKLAVAIIFVFLTLRLTIQAIALCMQTADPSRDVPGAPRQHDEAHYPGEEVP